MSAQERRASASLALIYSLRVLGLFMILPLFTLYASHLQGSTAALVGLALGIYGLTQASLQIPLGMLSDRIGRKSVITLGLLLFALGSLICAEANSIHWMIVGRALQGAGAIGSALMALVTDLTRETQRSKAMAMIGASIGTSFTLAMVMGPVIGAAFSVPMVFTASMGMACVAIIILHRIVPVPEAQSELIAQGTLFKQLSDVLKCAELRRLNLGVFSLHAILAASFVALPIILHDQFQFTSAKQWHIYLPTLVTSFLLMLPILIWSERNQTMGRTRKIAIGLIALSQLGLWLQMTHFSQVLLFLLLFFIAFNLLEASLPAQVSQVAPAKNKGAALGVYSSCQFLGIFIGGTTGGWLYGHGRLSTIFIGGGCLGLLWLGTVCFAPKLSTKQSASL